jgi:hypothetical protein
MQPVRTGVYYETGDKPFEFLHSKSCFFLRAFIFIYRDRFVGSIPYSLLQLLMHPVKKYSSATLFSIRYQWERKKRFSAGMGEPFQ